MGQYTKQSKQLLASQMFTSAPGFDAMAKIADDLVQPVYEIIQEKDLEQYARRGVWYNLPDGLDSTLIERILYYKGRGALFYIKTIDKFYFLPFTLHGDIDVVGKYLDITPLVFGGDANEEDQVFIDGLIKSPIYQVLIPEQLTDEIIENGCVILNDRIQKRTQYIKPRADLQDSIINLEACIVALMRTAIMNKVGVKGVKSSGPDDSTKIIQASRAKWLYALAGFTYLPIENGFEELQIDDTTSANLQEMFMALQSIDNFRLDGLGILNGGVFEKQGTILQTEAEYGVSATQLIEDDYVKCRQDFCNIVNSIWGLNIWYEPTTALNKLEPSQDQAGSTTTMYENEQSQANDNDNGGDVE